MAAITSYKDLVVWRRAAETETLLMLAGRFNFAPKAKMDELTSLTDEIGRMLNTPTSFESPKP